MAIVTGGGSRAPGIGNGRAAAVLLAQAGARVVLIDKVPENATATRELIERHGGSCLVLTADICDIDDCQEAVQSAVSAWDRIDILVNNVGSAGPQGTVVDVDLEAWEQCMRINVTSMMLMSRLSIRQMRKNNGGSIINISSITGLTGGSPLTAYSTAKGAVISLTKTMACQHGREGIRVNAVAPGYVYTPIVYAQGMSQEERQRRMLAAPLGVEGNGWDVGHAVLFLASSQSRWITGTVVTVDAGLTADGMGMTMSTNLRSQRPSQFSSDNPSNDTYPGTASQ